jgi:hypothetical protein
MGDHLNDSDLKDLVRRATMAFDTLTPEQQAAYRREQAIDWAYGQLMASTHHRGVTREQVARVYDARQRETPALGVDIGSGDYSATLTQRSK